VNLFSGLEPKLMVAVRRQVTLEATGSDEVEWESIDTDKAWSIIESHWSKDTAILVLNTKKVLYTPTHAFKYEC